MGRLVINGEEIYELDEECLKEKKEKGSATGHSYVWKKNPPEIRKENVQKRQ